MRWVSERTVVMAAAIAGLEARTVVAHGEGGEASYGRIDGDVTLVAGAGGVVAAHGPRASAEIRARYLETVGLFASYEDGPLVGSLSAPRRVAAAGFELRPLFLYRWLRGYETQRVRWDLVIDSFGFELGVTLQQSAGEAFTSRPGVEAGVGVEFPILAVASGPWLGLHGGVRWSDNALGSGIVDSPEDREAYLSITLAWHLIVSMHIVDVGDLPPR